VLITPDSSEIRWVSAVPRPGVRINGRFQGTWLLVDEVFRSGALTYTVFASTAPEGLLDQARDLAADAVERVQESASPTMLYIMQHLGSTELIASCSSYKDLRDPKLQNPDFQEY
jgi:hypothetical protein